MKHANKMGTEDGTPKRLRCAIYTRKSTTEGLEQDFNTLDAQREACERFVESQKGEGWVVSPTRYDDGGFTGGNMDRPALKALLDDVRAGKADCVVVYKVDRLSRSLLDFARIIEMFETHGVAFVSVTQQFNTNSSMGRLTLNVLLSFAQFEREIISERTRDKMGAARRRGKFLGGRPPLGYDIDPKGRRLIVNEAEKAQVLEIFQLYVEKRSILAVVKELNARGWLTKAQVSKSGRKFGGGPYQVTTVQQLLTNILFTGQVLHEDKLYPGEHEAIMPEAFFREAEAIRNENQHHRTPHKPASDRGLLQGILRCGSCGGTMVHTYTQKGERRYPYYVCVSAQKRGYDTCPEPSVSTHLMEEAALRCLRSLALQDGSPLAGARNFFEKTWEVLAPVARAEVFRTLVERVDYDGKTGGLRLVLSQDGLEGFRKELVAA